MPANLYRFRPVAKLLGDDKNVGELEGEYIYFASPEQLNDPMEGYKDIFWKGDKIVWKNLFRNYFHSLALRSDQYFTGMDLSKSLFPIRAHTKFIAPEVNPRLSLLCEEFINNKNVERHVDLLVNPEREIRREELGVHLKSIHPFALKVLSKLMADLGLIPQNHAFLEIDLERTLSASTALIKQLEKLNEEGVNHDGNFYKLIIAGDSSRDLLWSYRNWQNDKDSRWMAFAGDFPAQYVRYAERLCHSEWYVACFMESCNNSAIWGTYGQNHKAVCLKFKTNGELEKRTLPLHMPDHINRDGETSRVEAILTKVTYDDKPQALDFFRSLNLPVEELIQGWYQDVEGGLSDIGRETLSESESWRESYWSVFRKSITTKMRVWAGEDEHRLIIRSGIGDFTEPSNRKIRYDLTALEGVIFGINTPSIEKFEIIKKLEQMCDNHRLERPTVYQAYYDDKKNIVDYYPILMISGSNN